MILRSSVPGQGCEEDPPQCGVAAKRPRHLVPVHPRQADIAEHHVRLELVGLLDALRSVEGHRNLVPAELQRVPQALGRVDVVFDHEHALLARRSGIHGEAGGRRGLNHLPLDRQPYRELRAAPLAAASSFNPSAVQLDQALHQGEPEAQTASAAVQGLVRLCERLKQMWQHLRAHPYAAVANPDERLTSGQVVFDGDRSRPAWCGEFGRVLQQIA